MDLVSLSSVVGSARVRESGCIRLQLATLAQKGAHGVRILGPLEVSDEGRRVEIGGHKQRALLLAPAARERGGLARPVDRRALGRDAPPTAAKTFRPRFRCAVAQRRRGSHGAHAGAARDPRPRLRPHGRARPGRRRSLPGHARGGAARSGRGKPRRPPRRGRSPSGGPGPADFAYERSPGGDRAPGRAATEALEERSRPTSRSAPPSWRAGGAVPATRYVSASAASSCSPSTARPPGRGVTPTRRAVPARSSGGTEPGLQRLERQILSRTSWPRRRAEPARAGGPLVPGLLSPRPWAVAVLLRLEARRRRGAACGSEDRQLLAPSPSDAPRDRRRGGASGCSSRRQDRLADRRGALCAFSTARRRPTSPRRGRDLDRGSKGAPSVSDSTRRRRRERSPSRQRALWVRGSLTAAVTCRVWVVNPTERLRIDPRTNASWALVRALSSRREGGVWMSRGGGRRDRSGSA